MSMPTTYHCSYCQRMLDAGEPVYTRVEAWERPGHGVSGHSGSSLVLRIRLPQWACRECITKLLHGVDPHQPSLT